MLPPNKHTFQLPSWIKNNCNPECDDNLVSERIEFYNKQPIKHSLFDTVIFNKQIVLM